MKTNFIHFTDAYLHHLLYNGWPCICGCQGSLIYCNFKNVHKNSNASNNCYLYSPAHISFCCSKHSPIEELKHSPCTEQESLCRPPKHSLFVFTLWHTGPLGGRIAVHLGVSGHYKIYENCLHGFLLQQTLTVQLEKIVLCFADLLRTGGPLYQVIPQGAEGVDDTPHHPAAGRRRNTHQSSHHVQKWSRCQ